MTLQLPSIHWFVVGTISQIHTLTSFHSNYFQFQLRSMESSCCQNKKSSRPSTPAQPSSLTHYNALLLMLKELLADVIDELVSVSNMWKINSLLQKFDSEAIKAHHMIQQAHQDMITAHTECVKAIQHVLSDGSFPRCSPPGGYSARDRVLDP
jgi:hypothetical protein